MEPSETIYIHIDDIDVSPDQPRKALTPEEVIELANDIKERGLLEPIIVVRNGERYTLLAGSRRIAAVRQLGKTSIRAEVRQDDGQADHLLVALAENIQRQDLSDWEEAEAIKKLMDTLGVGINDIARIIHKSNTYVSRRIKVFDTPELRDAVIDGRISTATAEELITQPDNIRADAIEQGITHKAVRTISKKPRPEDFDDDNTFEYAPMTPPKRPSLEEIFGPRPEPVDDGVTRTGIGLGEVVYDLLDSARQIKIDVFNGEYIDPKCWDRIAEAGRIIQECLTKKP